MLPLRSSRSLSGRKGTPPLTAFSSIDGSTNGQLTSSAALPCSSASRAVPSSVWVIDGSAPGAVATALMICSALTVAARCSGVSVSVTVLPSSESTWPPALASNVLNHTTRPSYCLACSAIQLGLPSSCRRVASATMASQVAGGSCIKSARYQSNWVLVVIGAAYSLSCHSAVFERAGQRVRLGVGLGFACRIVGQRQRPTGLGELGGPHHVERHHVERLVVAGESARQLQPLVVGALGQADLLDGEAAAEFVVAALRHRGEGGHLAGRCVVVDDDAATLTHCTPTPSTPSSAQPTPQRTAA